MATPIEMPKPGITVEECLLVRWLKRPGEPVAAGETVAEIETDKATFELPAPVGGTLLAVFVQEGQTAPVYSTVGVIGEPGEPAEAFRPGSTLAAAPAVAAPPVEPAVTAPPPAPQTARLSPRARRFAREHGLDLGDLAGSGPGGRVLERDLERLLTAAEAPTEPGVPLTGVRLRIAERMRASLAHTAQYTLNASADAVALLGLRERIKQAHAEGRLPDITINELVMFAVVRALLEMPELNAELIEGRLYRRDRVNLAFACETPRGLLAPVVKDSQKLSLAELSVRVKTLAQQAVEGGIAPEDLSGGTFTVSNLGAYGVESFTPILNPPQVALLGVNTIQLKPVRQARAVEFREHIGLSLTCDHQVVDGALGARFLAVLRERIENIEALAGLAGL